MLSIDCKNFLIESLMIIAFMQPKENFLFSLFPMFWKEKKNRTANKCHFEMFRYKIYYGFF